MESENKVLGFNIIVKTFTPSTENNDGGGTIQLQCCGFLSA
jgi:hypothetical protein